MTRRLLGPAVCAVLATGFGANDAEAACYSVYRAQTMVYRSIVAPVDLSKQLHETVPMRFGPGASMVIAESVDGCRDVDERPAGALSPSEARARRTATKRRADAAAERYIEQRAEPIDSEVGAGATGARPTDATTRRRSRPAL